MAFVFENPRWKQEQYIQPIGPGSYDLTKSTFQKLGIITPLKKIIKNQNINKNKQSIICQTIIVQRQKAKVIKSKSKTKHQSLKSKNVNQNSQNQCLNFKITNSVEGARKQFQNNLIKNSLGEVQKNSIHSLNSSIHKKNMFSDNKMRSIQSHNKNFIDITNFCIKPNSSEIQLIKKSVGKQPIKGNKYIVPQFMKNKNNHEKENFIISSGNLKKKKRQLISAKVINSKFIKNQLSNFNNISQTTRLQDQQSENSFQYFQQATPGPGYYDINKSSLKINNESKVQQFGVKQNRFKILQTKQKLVFFNYQIPNFKKSSKASQQKVAFGITQGKLKKQQQKQFLIYQDINSIQNKSLKNLIKYRKKGQNFLSNCQRFTQKQKSIYKGPDFLIGIEQKNNKTQLLNYMFMSKVNRQHSPSASITKEIDFHGQDFYSIQKNFKIIEQNKQFAQVQAPGFSRSQSRFNYQDKVQKLELSKISKNLTRATSALSNKAYTFNKSQNEIGKIQNETPEPWKYQTSKKWIKQSHHVRFKYC